jgi:hypothetical protein
VGKPLSLQILSVRVEKAEEPTKIPSLPLLVQVLLVILAVPLATLATYIPQSVELTIQHFSILKCFVVPVMEIPSVGESEIFQPEIIYGSVTVPMPLVATTASSSSLVIFMGARGV